MIDLLNTINTPNLIIPPLAPLEYSKQITSPFNFQVYTYTVSPEIDQYTKIIYDQFFSIEGINKLGSWTLTWLAVVYDSLGAIGLGIVILLSFIFAVRLVTYFVHPIGEGWAEAGDERIDDRQLFWDEFNEDFNDAVSEINQPTRQRASPADTFQRDIDEYQGRF